MKQAIWTSILFLTALSGCSWGGSDKKPDTSSKGLHGMADTAEQPVTSSEFDREPNDSLEQASEILWRGEDAFVSGVLSSPGDIDTFLLQNAGGQIGVAVSLSPKTQGDLALGFNTSPGGELIWINATVDGQAESLPNLKVGPQGLNLQVKGSGTGEIEYTLSLRALSAETAAELEPNDSQEQAFSLQPGALYLAYVNRSGDRDFFSIPGQAQGPALDIYVTPNAEVDLDLSLFNQEREVWHGSAKAKGAEVSFLGLRPDPMGYTLIVEAIGESRKTQVYQLRVDTHPIGEGPVEYEPNDELRFAQLVKIDEKSLKASLSSDQDLDYYKLQLNQAEGDPPKVLQVRAVPAEDLDLKLEFKLVEAGLQLSRQQSKAGEEEALCNLPVQGNATLELLVRNQDSGLFNEAQSYELITEFIDAVGQELEPNDNQLTATSLLHDQALKGWIHPTTDRDVFAFDIPKIPSDPIRKARIKISITDGYKANLILSVKDVAFADVARKDSTGWGEGEVFEQELPPGRYYAVVSSHGASSCTRPYSIEVMIPPEYFEEAKAPAMLPTDPIDTTPPETLPPSPTTSPEPSEQGKSEGAEVSVKDKKEELAPETIDEDSF